MSPKIVYICLGLVLTAFCIATIVMAVQKSNLETDLDELHDKYNKLNEKCMMTTTTVPPTVTTTAETETTPEEIVSSIPTVTTTATTLKAN